MAQRRPPRPRSAARHVAAIPEAAERRKLIAFDSEIWRAVDQLARDRMMTVQELAEEAFADLLAKHGRPADLHRALRASVNDPAHARQSRRRQ